VDKAFPYALHAPDPKKRWELLPYSASGDDIAFALEFIKWNTCEYGFQRVDACRLDSGELLLMELEDYNPFLSLELLRPKVKEQFMTALCASIQAAANSAS